MKTTVTYTLIMLSIASGLFGCKAQKYTPLDYPDRQLTFGSGGGFSNVVTLYVLFENGHLYTLDETEENYMHLGKVRRKTCKQYFERAGGMNLMSAEFEHPGNRYYFVGMVADGNRNQVTWGSDSQLPDPAYKTLYDALIAEAKLLRSEE